MLKGYKYRVTFSMLIKDKSTRQLNDELKELMKYGLKRHYYFERSRGRNSCLRLFHTTYMGTFKDAILFDEHFVEIPLTDSIVYGEIF